MKRRTVILISLISVLLLAGICACKQEATPEEKSNIPRWEKSDDGLRNLPDINTSGTGTGVSEALVNGLNNPPQFNSANNLIVMVCEGLTSKLIESSTARYGKLILNSLPVKGTTSSKFSDSEGTPLSNYIKRSMGKLKTGMVVWGDSATNSLRRITTTYDNTATNSSISDEQFYSLVYVMGKGDFSNAFTNDSLNDIYKAGRVKATTLEEAVALYGKEEISFSAAGHATYTLPSSKVKLYTVFENDGTLPSFRKEMAFSLAWMQQCMINAKGFCLLSSYSPSSALDVDGVKEFDEGVALAVKYVLENPDTALLICGCPADGSEANVCFYGLGKGVSAKSTFFESVSSLDN